MYIWKNFYTWTLPNYNLSEKSEVDKDLVKNEFKTIKNIHFADIG